MHALGDYVSNMASDFFNTDYLRQKVVKAGMKVQTDDVVSKSEENEIKVPKFKLRQQNFVSQIEIDKNTRFYIKKFLNLSNLKINYIFEIYGKNTFKLMCHTWFNYIQEKS